MTKERCTPLPCPASFHRLLTVIAKWGHLTFRHSMGYISSKAFVTASSLVFTPCPVSLLSRHCHMPPKCSTMKSTSSKPTAGTSLWFYSSRIHGRARRLQESRSSLLALGYLATGRSLSKEWLLPCRIHTSNTRRPSLVVSRK